MLQAQIFIDKDKQMGRDPLYKFILKLLLENGIAGATSYTGYSGFGKHQVLKQPGLQFSFDETPLIITFIDKKEKVTAAINELRKQYRGGFITTHAVEQW